MQKFHLLSIFNNSDMLIFGIDNVLKLDETPISRSLYRIFPVQADVFVWQWEINRSGMRDTRYCSVLDHASRGPNPTLLCTRPHALLSTHALADISLSRLQTQVQQTHLRCTAVKPFRHQLESSWRISQLRFLIKRLKTTNCSLYCKPIPNSN